MYVDLLNDNNMNKICENCDTKNRLKLCNGNDGSFKYCFRKIGSLSGVKKSILPFNTLEELYSNSEYLSYTQLDSLHMIPYCDHMMLLMGKYDKKFGDNREYPLGYITVR